MASRAAFAAYLAAVVALGAYLVSGALARSVPAPWIVVWVAELLLLAAAPRWPMAAVAAYLTMAYAVSSHGSLHDMLLSMRMLDGVAGLALVSWILWRSSPAAAGLPLVRVPHSALALFAWVAVCVAVATSGGLPFGPFPRHDPSFFFQAAALLALVADTLRTRSQMAFMSLMVAAVVIARALLQAPGGIHLESYLATLAVVCVPLALAGAALATGAAQRVTFWLLAAGLAGVVVIGQNRAAAVAAIVAGLWFMQQQIRWSQLRRGTLLALPAFVLAIGAWLATSSQAVRFRSLWDSQAHVGAGLDRATASERIELWHAGWEMTRDHPIFGVGPGNYQALLPVYRSGMDPLAAHSSYVQMAAESGILGLMLYLALFGGTILALSPLASQAAAGNRMAPVARLLQASLVAYLAGGVFNSRHDFVLAYVIVGWALAVVAASRRRP